MNLSSHPQQLALSDELQPLLPSEGVGLRKERGASAAATSRRRGVDADPGTRAQTIWAHEASHLTRAAGAYVPVLRRDPDWVARTLDAAQRGVIKLGQDDAADLVRLLDEQFVFEAVTLTDLDDGMAGTLQEKRRRALARARQGRAEIEDLHIPLCKSIQSALTSPASSHWLIDEIANALKGELKPAIQQAESLHALLVRLERARQTGQ